MAWWIYCVIGYALGAIPFGVIVAKMKGIDIMKVGSGNIGATNVLRVLGPKWGLFVFGLDALKGAVPAILAKQSVTESVAGIDPQMLWLLAGLAAVAGHCLSPFLKFKGGKGIATAFGMVIGAAPITATLAFSLFLIILWATRYVSLASIIAVPSAAVFGAIIPGESRQLVVIYVLLGTFVFVRHKENIARLRSGTERKFVFKKTETVEPQSKEAESPKQESQE